MRACVVYEVSRADWPHRYAVKRWERGADGELHLDEHPVAYARSLEEAHAAIPQGALCLRTWPDEGGGMVELWA